MKKVAIGLVVLLLVGAAAWWFWPRGPGVEELRLPGTVEEQEVRFGSKVGGRVASVLVHESQVVEPGTILVTFDGPELLARRDQSKAKLAEADAVLTKANRGPRVEEIAEAKGAAEAAKARLDKLISGFREEQKEQAKYDLIAAQAEKVEADRAFARAKELADSGGAFAKSEYDSALAARDRTHARVKSAQANLEMMVRGFRPEEIAEARAEYDKWTASYQLFRNGTREEDKAAAYAAWSAAQAALAEAEANLREATVVAPERCVIEVVSVRPGDLIPPGQPVIRALRTGDLWVKAFVPAVRLGNVKLGQSVEVAVDSHPGRRFTGQVVHISGISEFTPRNVQSLDERQHQVFAIKVRVDDPGGVFKSGMAAEVFIPRASPARE